MLFRPNWINIFVPELCTYLHKIIHFFHCCLLFQFFFWTVIMIFENLEFHSFWTFRNFLLNNECRFYLPIISSIFFLLLDTLFNEANSFLFQRWMKKSFFSLFGISFHIFAKKKKSYNLFKFNEYEFWVLKEKIIWKTIDYENILIKRGQSVLF